MIRWLVLCFLRLALAFAAPVASGVALPGEGLRAVAGTFGGPDSAAVDLQISATLGAGTDSLGRTALAGPGSEAPVYDADGNFQSDARWTCSWDALDRLIGIETAAGVPAAVPHLRLAFTYDSVGRRIRKEVWQLSGTGPATTIPPPATPVWVKRLDRRFHYLGWDLIAETDPDGSPVRTYLWGLDLSGTLGGAGGNGGLLAVTTFPAATAAPGTAPSTQWIACDGNANVTLQTDAATGSVSGEWAYDPFGNVLTRRGAGTGANPFRFSTRYTDEETGLLYYGYRYLDPESGRWLNRDPLGESGGVNLYGFAGNDGVNGVDRLGLDFLFFHEDFGVLDALHSLGQGALQGARNVGAAYTDVTQNLNETGAWWGDRIGHALYDSAAWEADKAAVTGGAGLVAEFWGEYATNSEKRQQVNQMLGEAAATNVHDLLTDPDKASKFFAGLSANAAFGVAGARGSTVILNSAGRAIATLRISIDEFRALQQIARSVPERVKPLCQPVRRVGTTTSSSGGPADVFRIEMAPRNTAAFNPADFADDVARIRAQSAARHGLDFPGAEHAMMMARSNPVAARAAAGFQNLQCVECASAVRQALSRAGLGGEEIIVRYPSNPGFIINRSGATISQNGVHRGILHDGRVYDNLFPNGLPLQQWLDEFEALGTRAIERTPF